MTKKQTPNTKHTELAMAVQSNPAMSYNSQPLEGYPHVPTVNLSSTTSAINMALLLGGDIATRVSQTYPNKKRRGTKRTKPLDIGYKQMELPFPDDEGNITIKPVQVVEAAYNTQSTHVSFQITGADSIVAAQSHYSLTLFAFFLALLNDIPINDHGKVIDEDGHIDHNAQILFTAQDMKAFGLVKETREGDRIIKNSHKVFQYMAVKCNVTLKGRKNKPIVIGITQQDQKGEVITVEDWVPLFKRVTYAERAKAAQRFCALTLNDEVDWRLFQEYISIYPRPILALRGKGLLLGITIFAWARQTNNMKSIAKHGYFTIPYRVLQMHLGLRSEEKHPKPERIIRQIHEYIAEIEGAMEEYPNDFKLELGPTSKGTQIAYQKGITVTEKLDQCFLKIHITGELSERFIMLDERRRKREAAQVRFRKNIREKAIAQKIAEKMEGVPDGTYTIKDGKVAPAK